MRPDRADVNPSGPDPSGGAWPLAPQGRVVFEVRCGDGDPELVADQLFGLGASAVAEMDGGTVLVADLDPAVIGEAQSWCARNAPGSDVRLLEVDPAWADEWRRHASARWAGRVLIRPRWVDAGRVEAAGDPHAGLSGGVYAGGGDPRVVEVVVDPISTFGSGSHPTTRMCAVALGGIVAGGEQVLDIGVGSGVLAVASLVLGAAEAHGLDIDPAAAGESTRCAELNGVADRYSFVGSDLGGVGPDYDLVLANLLVGTIEQLGTGLMGLVASDGALVLSGFLADQRARVLDAVGATERDVRRDLAEEGWAAVVLSH